MSDKLAKLAHKLLTLACDEKLSIVTAESCTAGLLCETLADAPAAGKFFHGGFVTYTKRQKRRALGVPDELLRQKGAVCPEVARAMAEGALAHSEADLSAAITGVAGPEADPDGNPIGRVCIGIARRGMPSSTIERAYGDVGREAIREAAVADALAGLIETATEGAQSHRDKARGGAQAR